MKKHLITSWRLWVSWAALLTLVIAIPVKANITDLFGDLEVIKAVDKQTAVAGETVTFTITMKNNHDAITATNVKVIDGLPFALNFVSSSKTLDIDGLVLLWEEPTLAPGATATLTVVTEVKQGESGEIENCAAMPAATGSNGFFDTNVSNNFSCVTINATAGNPNPPPPPAPNPPPAPPADPPPPPNPVPPPPNPVPPPPPPSPNPPPPAATPPPPPPNGGSGSPPPPSGGGGTSGNTGTITGIVFNDANGNGIKDQEGEVDLSGWVIYLDANDNGALDAGETSTMTASPFGFSGLANGTHIVRQILQNGWQQIAPGAVSNFKHIVTISGGGDVTDKNFGNKSTTPTSSGSGGGGGGPGGGPGGNSAPPSGSGGSGASQPPGQVLGDFIGLQMPPPPGLVLAEATSLPRTGAGLPVIGFALEFGLLATLVLRKLRLKYL